MLSCALQGTVLSPSSVPQLRLQVWVGEAGAGHPTRRPAPLGPALVPAALTSAARQELQAPTGYPGAAGPLGVWSAGLPPPPQGCTPENCSVAAAEPGASQSLRTQPVGWSCRRLQPCPGFITRGQGPCPGRPDPRGFQLCHQGVFGQVGLAVGQPAGVPDDPAPQVPAAPRPLRLMHLQVTLRPWALGCRVTLDLARLGSVRRAGALKLSRQPFRRAPANPRLGQWPDGPQVWASRAPGVPSPRRRPPGPQLCHPGGCGHLWGAQVLPVPALLC